MCYRWIFYLWLSLSLDSFYLSVNSFYLCINSFNFNFSFYSLINLINLNAFENGYFLLLIVLNRIITTSLTCHWMLNSRNNILDLPNISRFVFLFLIQQSPPLSLPLFWLCHKDILISPLILHKFNLQAPPHSRSTRGRRRKRQRARRKGHGWQGGRAQGRA